MMKLSVACLVIVCAIVNAAEEFVYPALNASVDVIRTPVTYYLGELGAAPTSADDYLYYVINLCAGGIQGFSSGVLIFSLPENTLWNTFNKGYVMAQVSNTSGCFAENCVFAQNYELNSETAIPEIAWTLDSNIDAIYIRVLAINTFTVFSMELSFENDVPDAYYPWTTNFPFTGSIAIKAPHTLFQYWRLRAEYVVTNTAITAEFLIFALAFCQQSSPAVEKAIQVALVAPLDAEHSLLEQWACPQAIPAEKCTNIQAGQFGWVNTKAAMYNTLNCVPTNFRSTTNGIYVVVSGWGADPIHPNGYNPFYLMGEANAN